MSALTSLRNVTGPTNRPATWRALVDTGASITVVSPSVISRLTPQLIGYAPVHRAGGVVDFQPTYDLRIRFGGHAGPGRWFAVEAARDPAGYSRCRCADWYGHSRQDRHGLEWIRPGGLAEPLRSETAKDLGIGAGNQRLFAQKARIASIASSTPSTRLPGKPARPCRRSRSTGCSSGPAWPA